PIKRGVDVAGSPPPISPLPSGSNADGPAARRGGRVLVRLSRLGGVGIQGLERARLAMAAHAADRPDARESPLVSPGGRNLVGHGLWHASGPRGRLASDTSFSPASCGRMSHLAL